MRTAAADHPRTLLPERSTLQSYTPIRITKIVIQSDFETVTVNFSKQTATESLYN